MKLFGVDFTSAPRRAKPITIATLEAIDVDRYALVATETCADWPQFDAFLRRPGPWLGAFDLPFGLPRALVESLGWPREWPALVAHYASLDRPSIRALFAAWCDARPTGSKFAHRRVDGPAGSSPSMKWVNPPVAWMLHAGVPRMRAAGLSFPAHRIALDDRIAVEGYPGFVARSITRASYKSDTHAQHTPARSAERTRIVSALETGDHRLGITVRLTAAQRTALIDDGSADRLDALLCAVQAAWASTRPDHGLPVDVDPLEGWIVGVPA